MGYFRLDNDTVATLAAMLKPVANKTGVVRMYDPVCKEGITVTDLAAACSAKLPTPVETYGFESDDSYIDIARANMSCPRIGYYWHSYVSDHAFGLIYLCANEATFGLPTDGFFPGHRNEIQSIYDKSIYNLDDNGTLILILEADDITPQFAMRLSRFHHVQLFRPANGDNRIVFIGQDHPDRGQEKFNEYIRDLLIAVKDGLASPMPISRHDQTITYSVPATELKTFRPYPMTIRDMDWLANKNVRRNEMLADLVKPGFVIPRPLTEVGEGHIVNAVIPAGFLNGALETDTGTIFLQGTTYQTKITKQTYDIAATASSGKQHAIVNTRRITQSEITALIPPAPKSRKKRYQLFRVMRDLNTVLDAEEMNNDVEDDIENEQEMEFV